MARGGSRDGSGDGRGGALGRAMRDPGRCYGSMGSCSRSRWPRGEQGGGLLRGGHGGRGGAAGAGSGDTRRKGGHLK
jgi:hypothetical protein